jgi:hypothetical protein
VLNTVESIAIVLFVVGGSLVFLLLLRRIWPTEQRAQHNDLIGWQVSVIGTTYAVIIGFMLFAVWATFERANGNAEAEANSLVNVVRSARGLPGAEKQRIQDLASEYVRVMLTEEWPAMSHMRVSPASHRLIEQLWATVMNSEIHSTLEQTSFDHTLTELSAMTEHRRMRQLQMEAYLPGILWTVLIAGAIATIVSACLFGSQDFKLHLIQVLMLATVLSLVLVAIADINRPFQGSVHIPPAGFERAREALDATRFSNR